MQNNQFLCRIFGNSTVKAARTKALIGAFLKNVRYQVRKIDYKWLKNGNKNFFGQLKTPVESF